MVYTDADTDAVVQGAVLVVVVAGVEFGEGRGEWRKREREKESGVAFLPPATQESSNPRCAAGKSMRAGAEEIP